MTLGFTILVALVIHGIILAAAVVLERREPAAGLVWVGALVLLPGFGVLFYWLFGRRKLQKVARWRDRAHARFHYFPPAPQRTNAQPNRQKRKLERLTEKVTGWVSTDGNQVRLLRNASNAYPRMLQAIDDATHHVHFEMYIFRSDRTGKQFVKALTKAARRGVQVRLLLDSLGCMATDLAIFRPLLDVGGKLAFFSPLRLRPVTQRLNFRNHRKLVVIDGRLAFIGGLNIGDEYRGLDPSLGSWRDTNLEIAGPAVNYVQQVFLEDWCYVTDKVVEGEEFFRTASNAGSASVQIVPSGPDLEWGAIHQAVFRAIAGADQRVFITSPYFVPDETMFHALTTSALAGIDVRLIVPSRSDLPLVSAAGRTYFPELLKAGVRIFEYSAGFIHAKTIIIDDWAASVGSANMDIRSFRLNFEINAFVYDSPFVEQMEQIFLADMLHSREVTLEHCRTRTLPNRLLDGVARLMSPLM